MKKWKDNILKTSDRLTRFSQKLVWVNFSMYWKMLLVFIVSILLLPLCTEVAFASDTVVGNMLCNVAGWTSGSTGRGVATLAVIIVGILAVMNKISWGIVLIHIVGVALFEGAGSIVDSLGTSGSGC